MSKSSVKVTRYYIPHSEDPACKIAGDLEQLEPTLPTQGRKIALILHGVLGHKDYLFQKRLAKLLPMDSFRFDFRGNHETPGILNMGSLEEDLIDLKVVVAFLSSQLGYVVDVVVGHSRGSCVGIRWICTTPEGAGISVFVNVAARYRMERLRGMIDLLCAAYMTKLKVTIKERWPEYHAGVKKQGYHEWKVIVAGKERAMKIYPEDVERFVNWDTSVVWDKFPQKIHVLTIHGLADDTVPTYDAVIYARALSTRHPGTHTLHLIEDANHNFIGKYDEVNETIIEWLKYVQDGSLRTGIWQTGVRGKL